jgi:DNA-binding winged helix-turn-helix (wHTH) protein/tetratricopeptide (TPR) repeat protein
MHAEHAEHPEHLGFAADFRVGDWLVEPSLGRLSRNGTVLRLRPQLVDLLVVLARHAGRTVSKDVILDSVWQGQHVAESGMTRCIAEIRQALEDDAHEPRVVQTIPKRGYRLVAPVEFVESNGVSGVGERVSPPPAAAVTARPEPDPAGPEPKPADPVPDPVGQSLDVAGPAPDMVAAPRELKLLPRRVGWTMGSLAGATLLLAIEWGASGWSRAPALSDRDTVLLADVTNATGDSAFDGTLKLALAVHLGQAPFLHILSSGHVRSALTLMGKSPDEPVIGPVALEVCRREGAAVLLAGSIARLGTHYAVGIEAIGCRNGDSIGRELLEVDSKDGVLTALETAAARLRRTLGESRASLRQFDVPIVQATTPSLEALKALSLGDYNREHARLGEALTFYRRATELDPQFAVAWARRGAAARNLGEYQESTPALQKAYDLRDRVSEPERFYILGHYYRYVQDDPGKAVETYRMWKRTYPGSIVPPTNLASLYINVFGQYAEALPEAREAVRLAPYSSIANGALVVAYLGTNQAPSARQALREGANRGSTDLLWRGLAFELAFLDDDSAAMQEHARWASGDAPATIEMIHYRALAAASKGRLREARQLWPEAASTAAQIGQPAWQAGTKVMEAETEALLGDPRRARAAAEAALAVDQQSDTMLAAALAFALSGDPARAGKLIEDAAPRARPGICSKFVWIPVGRALVAAGSGRFEEAREILRQAAPFERGRQFGLAPIGVRASIELSAGRFREAATIFEELLRFRAVGSTSPWVPFARLGLARALRDAGDVTGSLPAYDAFLDSMKSADADAPLLVAARRERAALVSR